MLVEFHREPPRTVKAISISITELGCTHVCCTRRMTLVLTSLLCFGSPQMKYVCRLFIECVSP